MLMFFCNATAVILHPAVKGLKRLETSLKFSVIELLEYCRLHTSPPATSDRIPKKQPAITVVTHIDLAPAIADSIKAMRFISLGKAHVSAGVYLSLQILHPADEKAVVKEVAQIASIPGVSRIFCDRQSRLLNYYAQSAIQSGLRCVPFH